MCVALFRQVLQVLYARRSTTGQPITNYVLSASCSASPAYGGGEEREHRSAWCVDASNDMYNVNAHI